MSLATRIIVYACGHADKKRDKNVVITEKPVCIRDLDYVGKGNKNQFLDIYYPEETNTKLPLIVNVHGGAWVYGNKEVYANYAKKLSCKGFVVANINYRLAPKTKLDGQLADLNAALKFLKKNGAKYFIDTERIFLNGDSAGAHLCSLFACIMKNDALRSEFPYIDTNISIKGLALYCGSYDFDLLKNLRRDNKIKWFVNSILKACFGSKYNSINLNKYSAIKNITTDFPPVYLMTSINDGLSYITAAFKEKLAEQGVHFHYDEYGKDNANLKHVFHLNMLLPESDKVNAEAAKFLLSL